MNSILYFSFLAVDNVESKMVKTTIKDLCEHTFPEKLYINKTEPQYCDCNFSQQNTDNSSEYSHVEQPWTKSLDLLSYLVGIEIINFMVHPYYGPLMYYMKDIVLMF